MPECQGSEGGPKCVACPALLFAATGGCWELVSPGPAGHPGLVCSARLCGRRPGSQPQWPPAHTASQARVVPLTASHRALLGRSAWNGRHRPGRTGEGRHSGTDDHTLVLSLSPFHFRAALWVVMSMDPMAALPGSKGRLANDHEGPFSKLLVPCFTPVQNRGCD